MNDPLIFNFFKIKLGGGWLDIAQQGTLRESAKHEHVHNCFNKLTKLLATPLSNNPSMLNIHAGRQHYHELIVDPSDSWFRFPAIKPNVLFRNVIYPLKQHFTHLVIIRLALHFLVSGTKAYCWT